MGIRKQLCGKKETKKKKFRSCKWQQARTAVVQVSSDSTVMVPQSTQFGLRRLRHAAIQQPGRIGRLLASLMSWRNAHDPFKFARPGTHDAGAAARGGSCTGLQRHDVP